MLLDGVDLSAKTQSFMRKDANFANKASEEIFNMMVDEVVLGVCFDVHKLIKTGCYEATQLTSDESPSMQTGSHVDIFGLPVASVTGLPSLKTVPQIECPNCSSRTLAASRFAPHLEKCMGMGRNSSRVASRRLANTKPDTYRDGAHEEEDDDDDEWVEPGKKENMRRRRDKNSPRRNKSLKFKGYDGDGSVTPPQSYDHLSLEERRSLLTNVCGVTLSNNKICLRPTRCGAHTDLQRREVRLKWLGGKAQDLETDMDPDSDGDTVALRESLSQLSNASSPAESVVSTSSNPGHSSKSRHRDKSRKGKKGRPGSKNGSSRGSTPPMEH